MTKGISRSFIILNVFLYTSLLSQNSISQADSLLKLKKYNTAFKLLNSLDHSNENPETVLNKVDIALNYFVQSIMHQIFSFKDISPNENILDYRGQSGSSDMYPFAIDSVLTRAIKAHPQNGKLYKSLGDFYYDVQSKYAGHWLIEDEELLSRAGVNYSKAITLGIQDYESLHNLGVIYLKQDKIDDAIPLLKKSIELNRSFPSSHYNLAYAYYSKTNYRDALGYALEAYKCYDYEDLKSDAARLSAKCYEATGKNKEALHYFEEANRLTPDNYRVLADLLDLSLKLKLQGKADTVSLAIYALGPTKPKVITDIMNYYFDYDLQSELPRVFQNFILAHSQEDEALGNIAFYQSSYYASQKNVSEALKYLNTAESYFQKCLKSDHVVFNAIKEARASLESKK